MNVLKNFRELKAVYLVLFCSMSLAVVYQSCKLIHYFLLCFLW